MDTPLALFVATALCGNPRAVNALMSTRLAMDFTANTVAAHSDSPGRQSIDEQLSPDPLQGDRS